MAEVDEIAAKPLPEPDNAETAESAAQKLWDLLAESEQKKKAEGGEKEVNGEANGEQKGEE